MTSQPPPDPYGSPQSDPYGQSGQSGQPGQFGQSGQYGQPGQPGQYGQPSPPPPGQQPYYGQPPPTGPTTNTMAIVSLVLSLAGLLTAITAPIGAILGHVARKQIRERGEQGEGLAMAGIIVGWILTGIYVLTCCTIGGLAIFAADSTA
jgi:hypothetical protein